MFGINYSTSISPSPWFHHQNSRFPPLKRCLQNAGPKLALGKHVKSTGGRGGPVDMIRRMVVFESLKTDDWFTL